MYLLRIQLGLFLILLAGTCSSGAAALAETVVLEPLKSEDLSITIDGHLDEKEWASAQILGNMRVLRPDTRAKPPYATVLKVLYTDKGLYVAFDMEQPKDTIVRRITGRDARRVSRDRVSFTIDTSGKGLYGYWMGLALGDNQLDGTILPERRYGSDWDGAWYGGTQITEKGWSAEYFIPWSQTAMPKVEGSRRIGIYLSRDVAELNETWGWPAINGSDAKFLSAFHPLEMSDVNPRKQWSVFPYVSGTQDRIDNASDFKAGFDLFWRPSSNLQLTTTVNPDFGSVESDDVVINLTADETFFPEKRLFFQEGKEIFDTTPRARSRRGQVFTLVNTRRIGGKADTPEFPDDVELSRREANRFAELYGAVKVTGQVGSVRYGFLGASEKDTRFSTGDLSLTQTGRDFAVARFLYESKSTGAYKALGLISTLVTQSDRDAKVQGLDFHYLSEEGDWKFDGQMLHSDITDEGAGLGGFLDITHVPKRGVKHSLALLHFDSKLDVNDLGFQIRNNFSDLRYNFNLIKTDIDWLRDMELDAFARVEINGDGHRTNTGAGTGVELKLHNLSSVDLFVGLFPERYDDRNSFDNGTFKTQFRSQVSFGYETDSSKAFSLGIGSSYRDELIKGRMLEFEIAGTWRPASNIALSLELKYVDRNSWLLHQEDEHFTTFNSKQWQPKLNVDYFLSAKQQLRLAFQWVGIRALEDEFFTIPEKAGALIPGTKPTIESDSFSVSQMNFQLRYRWQIAPLSDLFVVYTRSSVDRGDLSGFNDLLSDSWDEPVGDQIVVKLRYRLGS